MNLSNAFFNIENQIIKFIQEKSKNKNGIVLGVSGGIDSAVVLSLCVKALGREKVKALLMPEEKSDVSREIKKYLDKLNVNYELIPIKPIYRSFIKYGKFKNDKLVLGNLKTRIRMSLLYTRSNGDNSIVMGAGNRSEILTGYFTKYGDGGVDFLPIGNLYKTQVKELARYLGVPEEIISQIPTAGLWKGQTDESELGINYNKLDLILYEAIDKKIPFNKVNIKGITKKEIEKVKIRIENNSFKIIFPQVCQIKQ